MRRLPVAFEIKAFESKGREQEEATALLLGRVSYGTCSTWCGDAPAQRESGPSFGDGAGAVTGESWCC
ncbi:hypothetical protein [Streptomyces sp. NPDC059080]|uniref:hypothetical protein n=1 Tax=Streptomyces sp. NPDC059080 TaxID=3346718 RepID=UPI0036BD494A